MLKTQSICPQDSFLFKSKFYKSGEIIHDTISSLTTCDTIVEIKINEFVVSKLNFNTDTIICKDDVVNLGATTTFQSYKWSTGGDKSNIQVRSGTYTLTVTDVNGCNVNSSITIKESPPIQYSATPMDPICPEDKGSIEITNLQGGTAPLEYYLNGKKVSLSALDNLNSGIYIFKAIDSENCEVSDTIQIIDAAVFDVSIKELIELEEGESYSLSFANHNPKISSIQVSSNSDVVIQNGTELKFSPKEDITYTITFTDERGCELIKTITFSIKRNEGFYPPTIFSPNGDNINDIWQPTYGNVYTLVSASIYDRWGEQVYYTNNQSVEWNGTYKSQQCNPGVYVYLIELRHRDGSVKKFSGDVGLIR
ncbi:MAG: gliding motility-associated C-terminal domain-containing protein [Saprospiraceae bacterium]|nr:gliding motility-associated C-terminal domain-containing protein [Saprospiraceae bacterium]